MTLVGYNGAQRVMHVRVRSDYGRRVFELAGLENGPSTLSRFLSRLK